jgi:hypothetical protein
MGRRGGRYRRGGWGGSGLGGRRQNGPEGDATARRRVVEGKALEFQHCVADESGPRVFEQALDRRSVDRHGGTLDIDRDGHRDGYIELTNINLVWQYLFILLYF